MQAKNWLFEGAIDAGEIQFAISGLTGVLQKTRSTTRVHLEAAALLAIAHIRRRDLAKATPLIQQVISSQGNIRSPARRRQFVERVVRRFEQEGLLAALRGARVGLLDAAVVEEEAAKLVGADPDDLFRLLGEEVSAESLDFMLRIDEAAKLCLPQREVKFLPGPRVLQRKVEVGRRLFEPVQRFVWRLLCDPEGAVVKAWNQGGYSEIYKKLYIGAAVATVLADLELASLAFAAPIAALVIQLGIGKYCERYEPKPVMIGLSETD